MPASLRRGSEAEIRMSRTRWLCCEGVLAGHGITQLSYHHKQCPESYSVPGTVSGASHLAAQRRRFYPIGWLRWWSPPTLLFGGHFSLNQTTEFVKYHIPRIWFGNISPHPKWKYGTCSLLLMCSMSYILNTAILELPFQDYDADREKPVSSFHTCLAQMLAPADSCSWKASDSLLRFSKPILPSC